MKSIALKLEDKIFQETEAMVFSTTKNRNRYINEALEHYNKLNKRAILAEKLKIEAELCKESSMEVMAEFDALPDGLEKI